MGLNLLMILMIAGFAGCASTQKQASADQLQTRYSELERQLEEKDAEIADLKDNVQNLSEEAKGKSSTTASRTSTTTEENYKKDGIIRVDVTPHKVQLALQNAGFYSGPIDGKVGLQTKKAISEFQKANSLSPDGILGRKTWETLKTHLN